MAKIKQNKEIEISKGDLGAVYLRLSKEDKTKNKQDSISNQKKIAVEWFKDKGYKIYKIYIDEFVSGAKDKVTFGGVKFNRKAFNSMVSDAKQHKFSFVWVKDFSRFSRQVAVQESSILSFNYLNIKVVSFFNSDDNSTMRQIRGAINEDYILKLRDQINVYHKLCLKDGIPISKPILGYKIEIKNNKNTGKWLIDKVKSKIVIKIFEDFVYRKMSFSQLDAKYKILHTGRIIRNKKYIGIFDYEGKEFVLNIPLFVPSTLFQMAQKRLEKKSKHKMTKKEFLEMVK